jgi:hypothetical protein
MSEQKVKAECPHCKGTDFYIHEFTYSKGFVDPDEPNIIQVHSCSENGIDLIECHNEKCPGVKNGGLADITDIEQIDGIEFNFN